MLDDKSNIFFENKSTERIFEEYKIKINQIMDSIDIQIQKKDSYDIYISNFKLEYLIQNNLLNKNTTIKKMIEFINLYIQQKKIKLCN